MKKIILYLFVLISFFLKSDICFASFQIDEYFIDSSRTEIYTKDGSKRELPATFWYPKNYTEDRKCPLVLFSHGGMGVRTSNLTLYRELASRGYVVCSIDHPYHCFSTILSNGKKVRVSMKFINETMKDEPSKNPKQSLKHFSSWMNLRTQDINYVLDTIIQNVQEQISNNDSTKINDIYQLIDCSKICVMGHSLGGCAALGIGRQRNDVRAVIALESAFMCDIKDIDEQNHFVFETSDYPIPVLNIYSDSSWSHLNEWPQYEENYRLLQIESSTVKNVHISGTGHFGLTDLSMTTPFITALMDGGMENKPQDTLKRINEECMAFLDSVLK